MKLLAGSAIAVSLLLSLPAQAAPHPRPAASATRDWSRTVVATPQGGFQMGNPNAPVKLVEYASLTCSHCAHFAAEGMAPLVQTYVKPGKVSFELRNLTRDAYDLTAALLSRCSGTGHFFAMTEQLLATQEIWLGRYSAVSDQQMQGLEKLPLPTRLQRLARIGGLVPIAARYGLSPARVNSCLADGKRVERLMEVRRVALEDLQLAGTPSFLVNGAKVEGVSWAAVEPLLKAPGH
jgi:protein-disulfide isomerase